MAAFLCKWNARACFGIGVYLSLIALGLLTVSGRLWDEIGGNVVIVVGALGIWRFGWWSTHFARSLIYARLVYPRKRRAAERVWSEGARPHGIHVMVTTYLERRETTERVVRSIIDEVRSLGVPAVIWLGSGDASDEELYSELVERQAADLDLTLVIARQTRPGKRYAIGTALRAMRRQGLDPHDIVVFMDGDAVIMPGMLGKCVPLFLADPALEALTTDEEVVVYGPRWIDTWLTMRFAQRRLAMQSHALSGKVLTLTGRLSLFRATYVTRRDFIEILEEDHLNHWLWGRFRFLSGDDKSTWYYMLRIGAKMIYVPDALCLTIEYIEGNGSERMIQNLRRWSGNMLRNGSRAISLGPRRVGPFIWWCLVDQRIAMWTMLIGPILAVTASIGTTPLFLITYLTWVLITRLLQSMVLWSYSRQVDLRYPVLLYVNQLANACVKVYCLFRLSKQRWTNRGNQSAGFGTALIDRTREIIACGLTVVSSLAILIFTLLLAGLVQVPSSYTISSALAAIGQY